MGSHNSVAEPSAEIVIRSLQQPNFLQELTGFARSEREPLDQRANHLIPKQQPESNVLWMKLAGNDSQGVPANGNLLADNQPPCTGIMVSGEFSPPLYVTHLSVFLFAGTHSDLNPRQLRMIPCG